MEELKHSFVYQQPPGKSFSLQENQFAITKPLDLDHKEQCTIPISAAPSVSTEDLCSQRRMMSSLQEIQANGGEMKLQTSSAIKIPSHKGVSLKTVGDNACSPVRPNQDCDRTAATPQSLLSFTMAS